MPCAARANSSLVVSRSALMVKVVSPPNWRINRPAPFVYQGSGHGISACQSVYHKADRAFSVGSVRQFGAGGFSLQAVGTTHDGRHRLLLEQAPQAAFKRSGGLRLASPFLAMRSPDTLISIAEGR